MDTKILYLTLVLSFFNSCTGESLIDDVFPPLQNVNELESTDFVVSYESTFNKHKNSIYAATIPMVWNEFRSLLGSVSNFTSRDLKAVNSSKGHENVLLPNEYEVGVQILGDTIMARSSFRKSLPFEEPLTKFEEPFSFSDSIVESFGFNGANKIAKLNYYKNTKSFSVTLFPSDTTHEIILVMTSRKRSSFEDYYKVLSKEKGNDNYFNDEDKVQIPIIAFHLEKSFETIIGSSFKAKKNVFTFSEFYQRNAFVLDENGAEVESEFIMEAADAADEKEPPKPKMLLFNKPFVVFLKRKDADKPYFGVYISNTELLKTMTVRD